MKMNGGRPFLRSPPKFIPPNSSLTKRTKSGITIYEDRQRSEMKTSSLKIEFRGRYRYSGFINALDRSPSNGNTGSLWPTRALITARARLTALGMTNLRDSTLILKSRSWRPAINQAVKVAIWGSEKDDCDSKAE